MLWFSIPAVILLASIPVLVIVSQIEDFNMRKYFTFPKIMLLWCYLWGIYFVYSNSMPGVLGMILFTVLWCWIDDQEAK